MPPEENAGSASKKGNGLIPIDEFDVFFLFKSNIKTHFKRLLKFLLLESFLSLSVVSLIHCTLCYLNIFMVKEKSLTKSQLVFNKLSLFHLKSDFKGVPLGFELSPECSGGHSVSAQNQPTDMIS